MWLFRLAQAWIYFGNAVGAAFVVGTAVLYAFIWSEPLVCFNAAQLGATVVEHIRPVIIVYSTLALGHGALAVRTTSAFLQKRWRSIRVHAVTADREQEAPGLALILPAQPPARAMETLGLIRFWRRVRRYFAPCTVWMRTRWAQYQAEITRLFMIWEAANQTYQANKMSSLIASVWINRLVSLVIVINCWFSPVLHYTMQGSQREQIRLARLLLDSWLDIVYNIGIPLVIFYPYYRDYTDSFSVFPTVLYYADTWYATTISELRQVFVTSWFDLVSKTTGGVALLYRLYLVEKVLKEAQGPHSRQAPKASEQPSRFATPDIHRFATSSGIRMTKILDLVLLVWGLVVLCLHIYSTIVGIRGDSAGCLLETRPWGLSTYSCVVREVSCKARDMTGDVTSMADALNNVDPLHVRVLIISHCAQLHMPPIVQDYSALLMFKVYNSTILTWNETAAFRDTTNPELQVIYFTRVNMGEIPAGLLVLDFPSQVWDIEFCITDLVTLPLTVVDAWRDILYLVVEGSPLFAEIPEAIRKLPTMTFVYLDMNGIRSIPDWVFGERELLVLSLNGNPLDNLPAVAKSVRQLSILSFQRTNVRSLPVDWIGAEPPPSPALVTIQAHGTPLCDAIAGKETVVGPFNITCNPLAMLTFPLDDEDKWRAANV